MKKLRPLLIIVVAVVIILVMRFTYYTVIRNVKSDPPVLNINLPSVSGIYPYLAVFNDNFDEEKPGETGIGALSLWGGKLYAITYSAHKPHGSSDKLYIIDSEGNAEIYPGSVGGTPANRIIHGESEQLIIGPYFIRKNGEIRVIPTDKMPGRLTATARHLEDPANKVYFYTMEEGLYEVDVNSLEVSEIYTDGNVMNPPDVAGPMLPGYHGKGAYTAQGRLIVANNGEYRWQSTPESGCLAEWDGYNWTVVERNQFTEVTGPGGLHGNSNDFEPVWSTGWDEKSVILKARENGEWFTYRLPKASFSYDGRHGWHTEWPRIRNVGMDKMLMTMHGMFWAFPYWFSNENTTGIRPYSSYLKIIPDFTKWRDKIVFGCDDASMFDNALVGQSQSNFWFINPDDLDDFGPRNAWASLWLGEDVDSFEESDPFLLGGFDCLMLTAYTEHKDAFKLNIEIKKSRETNWEFWRSEMFGPFQEIYRIIEIEDSTEWIRLSPDTQLENFSVHLHLSQKDYDKTDDGIFESIAGVESENYLGAWVRPNGKDRNLSIFYPDENYFTMDESLNIRIKHYDEGTRDIRNKLIPLEENIGADSASVYYIDGSGTKWRMPWGTREFCQWYADAQYRNIREVATERSLMNIGGIFYELPRDISGGIRKIKAICTHNRKIVDFCSWRGLMAISGTNPDSGNDGHFFGDGTTGAGIWLGTIDDLWSFGKPTGKGGPWYNSEIESGEFSDPYFMLGFDQKELVLSHDSSEPVNFELYADFTGEGKFRLIRGIKVNSGEEKYFRFPDGFSANWVKLKADRDCHASAIFHYK